MTVEKTCKLLKLKYMINLGKNTVMVKKRSAIKEIDCFIIQEILFEFLSKLHHLKEIYKIEDKYCNSYSKNHEINCVNLKKRIDSLKNETIDKIFKI